MRLAGGSQAASERRLLAGGGVAVDDALADGPVELADGLRDRRAHLGALARACELDGRADLRANAAVAQAPALVLTDPLLRRRRVRHLEAPSFGSCLGRVDRRESCRIGGGFSR